MLGQEAGDFDATASVYRAASQALPECLFINFAHADFLERMKRFPEARRVYARLRKNVGGDLVWIRLQQFARRSEGVEAARKVFRKAREGDCGYQVYVAAAHMELYANKEEQVARNIFEHGFRRFSQETDFILEYIRFLVRCNDDNSTLPQRGQERRG